MELEKAKYQEFLANWYKGVYQDLRFGQAFYNFFNLHRLAKQDRLDELFNTGRKDVADKIIAEVFQIK